MTERPDKTAMRSIPHEIELWFRPRMPDEPVQLGSVFIVVCDKCDLPVWRRDESRPWQHVDPSRRNRVDRTSPVT